MDTGGELYTVQQLIDLYEQYVAAGSVKAKQARYMYQNVANPPLLHCDPFEQVLGLVAVPELHLMLGITYKLRVALETKVSPTKEEGKAFMDDFLDVTNIRS